MTCVPQGGGCEGYHPLAKSPCGQLTCPQCNHINRSQIVVKPDHCQHSGNQMSEQSLKTHVTCLRAALTIS